MWEKMGSIYCASEGTGWRRSHAFVPTPFQRTKDVIRIYTAFLDERNVGRVGYVDLSSKNPLQVLSVSVEPALDIGEQGCFDDSGVTPMCVIPSRNNLRLYYTGWQLSTTVRYYLLTGLAVSQDGGDRFVRVTRVPTLERSDAELTIRTAAHVMLDGTVWKMWYIGGSRTIVVGGKQVPTYDMRYLESDDGLSWPSEGTVIMRPVGDDEYGFGRPYVLRSGDGFEMWYSVRSRSRGYHLGYATSRDGLRWERQDKQMQFCGAESSWDSQMQAFGAVLDCPGGRYLFYNGNDYGRTGFGLAIWRG